jgi:hypothetical protein
MADVLAEQQQQIIRRIEQPLHPQVIDDLMRMVSLNNRLNREVEEGKPLTREQIEEFRRLALQSERALEYLMRNDRFFRRGRIPARPPESISEGKE